MSRPRSRTPETIANHATRGAGGTVERCEEPVAGGVDLSAAVPAEEAPNGGVMPPDDLVPPAVAQAGCSLGRSDDVREQDRGKGAGLSMADRASDDEPLALIEQAARVAQERPPILPVQLDQLRFGDRRCEPFAPGHGFTRSPILCSTWVGTAIA
jgi:hypothetical protein